jgi:hypothetical protein
MDISLQLFLMLDDRVALVSVLAESCLEQHPLLVTVQRTLVLWLSRSEKAMEDIHRGWAEQPVPICVVKHPKPGTWASLTIIAQTALFCQGCHHLWVSSNKDGALLSSGKKRSGLTTLLPQRSGGRGNHEA